MSFWLLFSAFWALSSAPRLALLVCDRVTGTFTTYKSPVKFSYLDTENCLSWSWQCCQLNYSSSLWNVQDCVTLAVSFYTHLTCHQSRYASYTWFLVSSKDSLTLLLLCLYIHFLCKNLVWNNIFQPLSGIWTDTSWPLWIGRWQQL